MANFCSQLADIANLITVPGVHEKVEVSVPGYGGRFEISDTHQMLGLTSWMDFNPFAALARGLWALSGEDASPEWAARYDNVMRNDLTTVDDVMVCPSSIGHLFPTILQSFNSNPYPIVPLNFPLLRPPGNKPGIRADYLTISNTHSHLFIDAHISWCDLARLPILFVQLSMLMDALAHQECMKAGPINLNVASVCATEELMSSLRSSPERLKRFNPYEKNIAAHFPAADCPDVKILDEVKMVVGSGAPPLGLKWKFLRKIVSPMFAAYDLFDLAENKDSGIVKAVDYLKTSMPNGNDWLFSATHWLEAQKGNE